MDTRTTLTITAKGQVTLKRSLLAHLGVGPGDRIVVDLCMPDGAVIKAAPRAGIDAFFGCLTNNDVSVSIDDMNKAIADGWAGKAR